MDQPQPNPVRPTPPSPHRSGRARPLAALTATAGALALGAAAGLTSAGPARAIERVELKLVLLPTNLSVNLEELRDPRALLRGTSDLAELDRATNGAIGSRLISVFNSPLPLSARAVASKAVGSPLVNQAMLLVSALVQVDGVPEALDGDTLTAALDRLNKDAGKGSLTLLEVLRALPGKTATVDLEKALFSIQRLQQQQEVGVRLLAAQPPVTATPALRDPGTGAFTVREMTLPVTHRPAPLSVVTVVPKQGANGRLVVISHGLWDDPENFEGWAAQLASRGYTVLLPRHPGSDRSQQQAMLEGKVPPPSPDDLRLRPLDVSAVIDGAAAGKLGLPSGVRTDAVVALGHSWGATTVLQLAGARPSATRIDELCKDVRNPDRNLSWVLQCSFRSTAGNAVAPDPRVKAVMAVSPMTSLLFDVGSSQQMNGRVLLVSGSRDWVVPSGPEAIRPMAGQARRSGGGHQLVLVTGGDHFNLRSPLEDGGGPLRGLILGWVDAAFAAGAAATPAPGAPPLLPATGWGDPTYPMVDVTPLLKELPGG